mmetsp:Transcript_41542/g.74626  ORF Transcript_41542/g.74626 Transcript_41542/m.74626 type:complete len:229 (+) Transcript_41542:2269-2955(+)
MVPVCVGPDPEASAAVQAPGKLVVLNACNEGGMRLHPAMANAPYCWLCLLCHELNEGASRALCCRPDEPGIHVVEVQGIEGYGFGARLTRLEKRRGCDLTGCQCCSIHIRCLLAPAVAIFLTELNDASQLSHSYGPVFHLLYVASELELPADVLEMHGVILLPSIGCTKCLLQATCCTGQVQVAFAKAGYCHCSQLVSTHHSRKLPHLLHSVLEFVSSFHHGILFQLV